MSVDTIRNLLRENYSNHLVVAEFDEWMDNNDNDIDKLRQEIFRDDSDLIDIMALEGDIDEPQELIEMLQNALQNALQNMSEEKEEYECNSQESKPYPISTELKDEEPEEPEEPEATANAEEITEDEEDQSIGGISNLQSKSSKIREPEPEPEPFTQEQPMSEYKECMLNINNMLNKKHTTFLLIINLLIFDRY